MAQDPLIPANSPFKYNIGIDYSSWDWGRTGRSIAKDLDQITANFKLIRTYYDAWNATPTMDATQKEVVDYVVAHQGIQLAMGTMNSALAQGGFGSPWSAGYMTSSTYTDQWAQMVISAFGGASAVKEHVAAILLGNEVDSNGPPASDSADFAKYQGWINLAFDNLSKSLANAGLGSIPISTTIANYPNVLIDPNANPIAVNTTKHILDKWSSNWNGGSPFVLFNQYTPAGPDAPHEAETTNYQPVIDYFTKQVQPEIAKVNAKAETFVGETGYSSFWVTASPGPGSDSLQKVYSQITAWLNTEYNTNGGQKTVPLFLFEGFDEPTNGDPVQKHYGIYSDDPTTHLPTGLKSGIVLPSWTKLPTSALLGTPANDGMVGSAADDSFYGSAGNDSLDGGAGKNTSVQAGVSTAYSIKVAAGAATLTVQDKVGTDGVDQLTNIQNIEFNDRTIDARWIIKAAGLPADQILKVVDLYTAGLNRAPDALGLDYWASRLADGDSIGAVAKTFFSSAEAAPLYTSANSNPVFVNLAYQTALGRAPDAAGAAYWLNELNTGHILRTDFVTSLIGGARGPGGSAADAQYIANKEAVGAHFALTQGLNNAAWARIVESGVNGTAASVTAANAQTDAFAAMAATSAGSELVVQILGIVP